MNIFKRVFHYVLLKIDTLSEEVYGELVLDVTVLTSTCRRGM